MAISWPGFLLNGALARLVGRVEVLPWVVVTALFGNRGGGAAKLELGAGAIRGAWGKVEVGSGGVEPNKLSDGVVSPGSGVGKFSEVEGSKAVFTAAESDVLAVCCSFSLMLLAYCQVTGKKPTPKTNTAATGAQAGNLRVELVLLRVGSAMTSVEYSSKALAKSNNCSRVS